MFEEGRVVENNNVALKYEDGILIGEYLVPKLDLEVAKDVMSLQIKYYGADVNFVITDLSKVKSVTKEARDFFSREEFTENIIAAAFIAPTILHKLMFTFFLTFNKPVMPVAFFTNLQDARFWIKKFQKVQRK